MIPRFDTTFLPEYDDTEVMRMILFSSTFYFFFGIGAVLGLLWVTIRYGIPLFFFFLKSIGEVFSAWGKAAKEGWEEGGKQLNASGKSRR